MEDLPGPLLLFKIMREYSVSNHTKCVSARNKISAMSIKKDPELDYSKLGAKLLQELHLIHYTDPDYLKGTEDVGQAIVKALTVEPGWVSKNIDNITLQDILKEMEIKKEKGEKMSYEFLERKLRALCDCHKNLKEVGEYLPATRKPKPEDQKAASLMAKVTALEKKVESFNGNTGGGGGKGGSKDKSNLECHACHQKGHIQTDSVCPKYKETMEKRKNGGKNKKKSNRSGEDSWKYTKSTEVIERNNQKYYWCAKCNKGKGMYVASHGPGNPTKPQHDDNFRCQPPPANPATSEQTNVAVDVPT